MSDPAWFVPLRLTDAAQLRLHGISLSNAGSLAALREEIRKLLNLCDHQVWLAGTGSDERKPLAVIGLQIIDADARRAVLHVFADLGDPFPDIIRSFLTRAFWQTGIYRLEIYLPADAGDEIKRYQQAGFSVEGRQRCGLYNHETRQHRDLVLLSLLRPEYHAFGTAFIPFRLGVFAVTGHWQGLTEAGFTRYGESFSGDYQQECAEMAGILDAQGQLQDRLFFADNLNQQSSIVQKDAPEPVLMAAAQVEAYFAGKRANFDLPLDLSGGSDFQTRVWQTLARIPYGTTWTYEELAYQLTANDWAAARRMARAVGSACGSNPLPLILPCHRVIGKDRRLVGFSGGLDIKELLLDHEIMRCDGGQ